MARTRDARCNRSDRPAEHDARHDAGEAARRPAAERIVSCNPEPTRHAASMHPKEEAATPTTHCRITPELSRATKWLRLGRIVMRECPDAWPPRSGPTLTPTGLLWLAREPMPRSATEATDRRSTTNAKTRTKRHAQRSQEKSGGTIRRRRDTLAECCRRKKPQQAATDVRITPELSRAAKRLRLE